MSGDAVAILWADRNDRPVRAPLLKQFKGYWNRQIA